MNLNALAPLLNNLSVLFQEGRIEEAKIFSDQLNLMVGQNQRARQLLQLSALWLDAQSSFEQSLLWLDQCGFNAQELSVIPEKIRSDFLELALDHGRFDVVGLVLESYSEINENFIALRSRYTYGKKEPFDALSDCKKIINYDSLTCGNLSFVLSLYLDFGLQQKADEVVAQVGCKCQDDFYYNFNLFTLRLRQGRHQKAREHVLKCLQFFRDEPRILLAMAEAVSVRLQDYQLASIIYRKILDAKDQSLRASAFFGLGNCYLCGEHHTMNSLDAADFHLRKAISLGIKCDAGFLMTLALIKWRMGLSDDALHLLDKIDDESKTPAYNAVRIAVLNSLGRFKESSDICSIATDHEDYLAYSSQIFALNYQFIPVDIFLDQHKLYKKVVAKSFLNKPVNRALDVSRPLRIAYVSPDFYSHSVMYFILPVVEKHDKSRFEVFIYSRTSMRLNDHYTKKISGFCDVFLDFNTLSHQEMYDQVVADGIDILVDLSGHTANNVLPLFYMKPAPIQISWIGYPSTTGLEQIQYKIVDYFTDPPSVTEHHYVEELVRLPRAFSVYQPPFEINQNLETGDFPCVEKSVLTFGSFNGYYKISESCWEAWFNLLHAFPNSRLLLKNLSMKDPKLQSQILAMVTEAGLETERFEFVGRTPSQLKHFEYYRQVDIALDTFPYNGCTTTCEALWMGVPVLTVAGERHAGRVGVSILQQSDLGDCIANNTRQLIECAERIHQMIQAGLLSKKDVREKFKNSPWFDVNGFVNEYEISLLEIANQYNLYI